METLEQLCNKKILKENISIHALPNILKYFILKDASIEQLIEYFEREKVYVKKVLLAKGNTEKGFWYNILMKQKLSENFIREFKDEVRWDQILGSQILPENCIYEIEKENYWNYISEYQKLSENFIREFQNEVIWVRISRTHELSENFIREFKDKVDWFCISKFQKLSENFIREFKDKVDWKCISRDQELSENFIREFRNEVHWRYMSGYLLKSSKKFKREFYDIIELEAYDYVSGNGEYDEYDY